MMVRVGSLPAAPGSLPKKKSQDFPIDKTRLDKTRDTLETNRMTEQQDGAFNHEQDAKMVFETSGDVKVINSFEDMKL